MQKIKVKGQSVQTGEHTQTKKETDRRTNGRYQFHYLPASRSIMNNHPWNNKSINQSITCKSKLARSIFILTDCRSLYWNYKKREIDSPRHAKIHAVEYMTWHYDHDKILELKDFYLSRASPCSVEDTFILGLQPKLLQPGVLLVFYQQSWHVSDKQWASKSLF